MSKALKHSLAPQEGAKSKKKRLWEERKASLNVKKTGWPEGLLQDDSKELSKWFASKLDARYIVRKNLNEDSLH